MKNIRMKKGSNIMYPELDLNDYFVQRTITEFPEGVESVIRKIYEDFSEFDNDGNDRTKKRAPVDMGQIYMPDINLIPSSYHGTCHPILVAVCYDGDRFEERLRNFLDHASIICAGVNRKLFFFSTQWDSNVVNRYLGYINSMRNNNVSIDFIYVTKKGMAIMPV